MATNKSGIFSLGDVGERQSTESWDTFGDVWLVNKLVPVANSSVGYVAGGSNYNATPSLGASLSSVRRLDYSNDLAAPLDRGTLSIPRHGLAAVGNQSYGYAAGGQNGYDPFSIVDRIDYSNDTATGIPSGSLDQARKQQGFVGDTS